MGIPKYFRHITKQYPELVISNDMKVKIDNLYFDMNCLIHPCVHKIIKEYPHLVKAHNIEQTKIPYINDLTFITKFELEIYKELERSLDKLIAFIEPTQLIYMSIDGVAPRAKMEQQRKRRYRSIKEKKMRKQVLQKYNLEENVFDTNCITPGTIFMKKLSNRFKQYIDIKYNELGIPIFLDDSSIIGEGEHKILQHMKKYSTDMINCVYGLDADLIMLSLVSHCKVFLLREAVHFGKVNMDELLLFNVDLFSEKLFHSIKVAIENTQYLDKCNSKFLLEKLEEEPIELEKDRIINDYICLCFLIGNDFLPHLPAISINSGGIHSLISIYCKIFKIRQRYLVDENNNINFIFIRQIITYLYSNETGFLSKYQRKVDRWRPRIENGDKIKRELSEINYYPHYNKSNFYKLGEKNWNNLYYKYHFNIENIIKNKKYIHTICINYIEGLQWNIKYYLDKCISYSWYYKYRASPTLKELSVYLINRVYPTQFENIEFNPLEQLSIVLPIQSNHLWSSQYKEYVKNNIELLQYYPLDFELDTLNKHFLHECEPKLSNLDNNIIKDTFNKITLTEIEKTLNEKGEIYIIGVKPIEIEIS